LRHELTNKIFHFIVSFAIAFVLLADSVTRSVGYHARQMMRRVTRLVGIHP